MITFCHPQLLTISLDHFRTRKTGPSHCLAVARCRPHGCGFTLYPPGYAPYRQQPVLKLAPDGSAVCTEEEGLGGDFSETVFHAALDGSNHLAWARDGNTVPSDRYWSTQVRHVGLAAALVGVAHDLTALARDAVATAMSASRMTQQELSSASGFRAVGTAVCRMLRQLRGSAAARASTLLFCGYIAGHWGEPLHWDEAREDLLRSPFSSISSKRPTITPGAAGIR